MSKANDFARYLHSVSKERLIVTEVQYEYLVDNGVDPKHLAIAHFLPVDEPEVQAAKARSNHRGH